MSKLEKKGTMFQVNISDIRGKKKSCEICNKDFNLLNKEHQCKRCKRAVCYNCSQTKAPVYRLKKFSDVPHRQCTKCKVESERMQKFLKEKKLVFGKDTISAQWLQNLSNKLSYPEITSEYFEYLNDPQFELKFKAGGMDEETAYKEYKKADANMEKIYSDLQESFNFSLQEFLFFVIQQTDQQTVCISIRNILKAFLCKHPEFGFSQELVLLIVFILCFASEPIAFTVICKFYENIYPKQLYPLYIKKNGFQQQRYSRLVLKLLQSVFQVPQGDAYNIQSYLERDFMRIASQMSLNTMTFENSFYLLDQTIQSGSFIEFLKGLTAICFIKMEEIKRYAHNIEKLEVVILRNVELFQIKENVATFDKVDQKTQEQVSQWINQEEEQGMVLDEKSLGSKILESEQYQNLQNNYRELQRQNLDLQQEFDQFKDYVGVLKQSLEQTKKQVEELAKEKNQLKEELYSTKIRLEEQQASPKEEIIQDANSELVKKRIQAMEAQLQESNEKLNHRTNELKLMQDEIQRLKGEVMKEQEEKRSLDKMMQDLAFENQTLQYEADMAQGRSRGRGMKDSISESPVKNEIQVEILKEQLQKTQDKLYATEKKLEALIEETAEFKMSSLRSQRILAETQYERNTLQMQVQLLEESLKKEKEQRLKQQASYEERINRQHKKSFESLQVVHDLNDELTAKLAKLQKSYDEIKHQLDQELKLRGILQEEAQKLKQEKEELQQMANMAERQDNHEDIILEFNYLLNDEDPARSRALKALFARIKLLQSEIRFKNIDFMIKQEYLTSLQKKNRVLNKELQELRKDNDNICPPPAHVVAGKISKKRTLKDVVNMQMDAHDIQRKPDPQPEKECNIF